eukprot:TRINITY_DN11435_c0_g1_i1.p1 TRINITY_DN11435_c0_g1~~TRINITY_DN11435_c0_g1_i1.p1  ORF type:complete len:195 (-),score=3.92 TRINITY_DN11435_c0_g1_i1:35-595(-)
MGDQLLDHQGHVRILKILDAHTTQLDLYSDLQPQQLLPPPLSEMCTELKACCEVCRNIVYVDASFLSSQSRFIASALTSILRLTQKLVALAIRVGWDNQASQILLDTSAHSLSFLLQVMQHRKPEQVRTALPDSIIEQLCSESFWSMVDRLLSSSYIRSLASVHSLCSDTARQCGRWRNAPKRDSR